MKSPNRLTPTVDRHTPRKETRSCPTSWQDLGQHQGQGLGQDLGKDLGQDLGQNLGEGLEISGGNLMGDPIRYIPN